MSLLLGALRLPLLTLTSRHGSMHNLLHSKYITFNQKMNTRATAASASEQALRTPSRLVKWPKEELKASLRALGRPDDGAKTLLAERLHTHLRNQPTPPSPKSSGEESGERPSSDEMPEETESGDRRSRRKGTRSRSLVRLSRSDLRR